MRNKTHEPDMNDHLAVTQHEHTGLFHGAYYRYCPTPSGCDRWLLHTSTTQGFATTDEAANAIEGAYPDMPKIPRNDHMELNMDDRELKQTGPKIDAPSSAEFDGKIADAARRIEELQAKSPSTTPDFPAIAKRLADFWLPRPKSLPDEESRGELIDHWNEDGLNTGYFRALNSYLPLLYRMMVGHDPWCESQVMVISTDPPRAARCTCGYDAEYSICAELFKTEQL